MRIVWAAGISSRVARKLGQDDRDWSGALMSSDPVEWQVRDVTKSAGDGFALDIPAQPQIAIRKSEGAIIVLLGQAPWSAHWDGPIPAAPALPHIPVQVRVVWKAGVQLPAPRGLGQAERDLFRALKWPGPGRGVQGVQYADFTLAAGNGFVVDSPELPEIAVGKAADAINLLLVPARADPDPDSDPDPFPLRPHDDMGPFASP